jgi:hypothetical protein
VPLDSTRILLIHVVLVERRLGQLDRLVRQRLGHALELPAGRVADPRQLALEVLVLLVVRAVDDPRQSFRALLARHLAHLELLDLVLGRLAPLPHGVAQA